MLVGRKNTSEEQAHEEADTLITNQVLASALENIFKVITTDTPDTDVPVGLVDLVSSGHLDDQTGLKMLTGKCSTGIGKVGLMNVSGWPKQW